MDGQLVRPPIEFRKLAERYVCVRVTDMQSVDLNRYRFDFDLTLCILLANADGTVYHRYGGRTHADPLAWMSTETLIGVMRATLAEHAAYQQAPAERRKMPRRTVYDIATFRKRMDRKPKRPDCIHCHTVHEAQIRDRQARGVFRESSIWIWPAPERIGLTMDAKDQTRVLRVAPDSVAAKAGLRGDDHLLTIGTQKILTINDLQWVLDQTPFRGGDIPVTFRRGTNVKRSRLRPVEGFKRTDALTYSWRPYKWALRPAPGFGGPELSVAQKKALGLAAGQFAFRVQYIVDWGDRPQQGRANRRAGLRKGDVVIRYAGKDDFETVPHFHAWTRLTRRRGETVEIVLLRGGRRQVVRVELK